MLYEVITGDDRFIVLEDTTLVTSSDKLLANDKEYDGEDMTLLGVKDASHGVVAMQPDGTIRFEPEAGYSGNDAGFTYEVQDGTGNISSAWVSVEVQETQSYNFV